MASRVRGSWSGPPGPGRYAQAIWERLEGAIERRWSERFGADLVAELRAAVLGAIDKPDRNLPLYLPMVQYADGMRTASDGPAPQRVPGRFLTHAAARKP